MIIGTRLILVSHDAGLLAHWRRAFTESSEVLHNWQALLDSNFSEPCIVLLDAEIPELPDWNDPVWDNCLGRNGLSLIAASSSPTDDKALAALQRGCVGYCHGYSDSETLQQVLQSVQAGSTWVGKNLMQRMLQGAKQLKNAQDQASQWAEGLTAREQEVAILASNGASNAEIARNCGISERTVKAHLSAVFSKINVTDRLQLALRVHGIH